jgi:hypothetical protein
MSAVWIGLVAWLGIQPLAVVLIFPLLRAASGVEPAPEPPQPEGLRVVDLAPQRESSRVVDLALWSAAHRGPG